MKKTFLILLTLLLSLNLWANPLEKSQMDEIRKIVKALKGKANLALADEYLKDEFIEHMDDKRFFYNEDTDTFYFDREENSPMSTIALDTAYRIKIGKDCFVENYPHRKRLIKSIERQIPEVAKFLLSYHKRMFGTQTSIISRLHTVKLCANNHDQDVAFETGTLYINNSRFAITGRIGQLNSMDDRFLFFHWNKGSFLPEDSSLKGLTWMVLNPISYARTALRYYAIQYAKKLNIDLAKSINEINEQIEAKFDDGVHHQRLINMLDGFDTGLTAKIEKKSLVEVLNIYKRAQNLVNNTEFVGNLAEAQAQANVRALANRRRKVDIKQKFAIVNHSNFHDIRIKLELFERYKNFVVVEDDFEAKVEQMFSLVNTYSVDIIDISVNLSQRALGAAAIRDAMVELGYHKE